MLGKYWNGTTSLNYGMQIYWIQDSTSPSGHLSFNLNNNGTLTQVASLDSVGNLIINNITLSTGYYFNGNGSLSCNTLNIINGQLTLLGTTAGTITYSEPFIGSNYKKIILYLNGYENTTATAQTITFPQAFTSSEVITANNTGAVVSVNNTTLTLPASMGAAATGIIIIEGV